MNSKDNFIKLFRDIFIEKHLVNILYNYYLETIILLTNKCIIYFDPANNIILDEIFHIIPLTDPYEVFIQDYKLIYENGSTNEIIIFDLMNKIIIAKFKDFTGNLNKLCLKNNILIAAYKISNVLEFIHVMDISTNTIISVIKTTELEDVMINNDMIEVWFKCNDVKLFNIYGNEIKLTTEYDIDIPSLYDPRYGNCVYMNNKKYTLSNINEYINKDYVYHFIDKLNN